MTKERLQFGLSGEEAAVAFLKAHGYTILARNFRSKMGEVDIIAKEKDTYCFVEVKSRRSDRFGVPSQALKGVKQRHIARAALSFIKEKNLWDKKARFDVVCVQGAIDGTQQIELIKNAFELVGRFSY